MIAGIKLCLNKVVNLSRFTVSISDMGLLFEYNFIRVGLASFRALVRFVFFTGAILMAGWIQAQSPNAPNEGLTLKRESEGFELSWWGRTGINYFIQSSDDLSSWMYEPVIESGSDQLISLGVTSTAPSHFFRLKMNLNLPRSGYYSAPLNIAFQAGMDANSQLRFTMDGSDPTGDSPVMEDPVIQLNARTRLRLQYYINGTRVGRIQEGIYLMRGKTIIAHGDYTYCLGEDGGIWGWGTDLLGRYQSLPQVMSGLVGCNEIEVGQDHCLENWDDRSLRSLGDNTFGQLGNGTRHGDGTGIQVIGNLRVKNFAAGDGFSVALTEQGEVYTWGQGYCGQLGVGPSVAWSLVPVKVSGTPRIQKIAAGPSTVYAIDTGGDLWVWGDNSYGQAVPTSVNQLLVPTRVPGMDAPVVAMAAGIAHALVLTAKGTVYSWGSNWYGQLGRTGSEPLDRVLFADGSPPIVWIASGDYHNLALTSDGTVYAWGAGWCGQNGSRDLVDLAEPRRIETLSNILDISAGRSHSVALGSDGAVYTWGSNTKGQLGRSGTASFPQITGINLFKK